MPFTNLQPHDYFISLYLLLLCYRIFLNVIIKFET